MPVSSHRTILSVAATIAGGLALMLTACTNPVSSTSTSTSPIVATISGRAYDSQTGAGLSGATVAIGSTKTTTGSTGTYSLSVSSASATVVGNLAVSDGTGYSFFYEEGAAIATTGGAATVNFPLVESGTGPSTVTVSGTANYADGTAVASGDTISLTIVNQNGGFTNANATVSSGAYSVSSATTGSNCFVMVTLKPGSGTTGESQETYYIPNVTVSSSGTTTLNLQPPSTGTTSVSVSGIGVTSSEPSIYVGYALDIPGYGLLVGPSYPETTMSATIPAYDPDNYPIVWLQGYAQQATAPYFFQYAVSTPSSLSGSASLPALLSPASSNDNLSSATYSSTTGTISFSASTDATGTILQLSSTSAPPGFIWMTGGSVTLPASIRSVINSATGWNTTAEAVNASTMNPTILEMQLQNRLFSSAQFTFSAGTNSSASSFPQ